MSGTLHLGLALRCALGGPNALSPGPTPGLSRGTDRAWCLGDACPPVLRALADSAYFSWVPKTRVSEKRTVTRQANLFLLPRFLLDCLWNKKTLHVYVALRFPSKLQGFVESPALFAVARGPSQGPPRRWGPRGPTHGVDFRPAHESPRSLQVLRGVRVFPSRAALPALGPAPPAGAATPAPGAARAAFALGSRGLYLPFRLLAPRER